MNVLLHLILGIIFVTFTSGQGTSPCHICEFAGSLRNNNYKFSISDLPERCREVIYGFYFYDSVANPPTYSEADKNAVRALVAAKITVYIRVGYLMADRWDELLNPTDQAVYNQRICPLLELINKLGVNGILLGFKDILDGSYNPNKLNEFITKLKGDIPSLKFALSIDGLYSYDKLSKKELFDFTVTNTMIDHYIIDMDLTGSCTPKNAQTGTLITSPDKDALTIEKVCLAVSQSPMEKSKTYARIVITVSIAVEDIGGSTTTYAEMCTSSNSDLCKMCVDNSQTLYDEGKTVKQYFNGITVAWLEDDDTRGLCKCKCKMFPATNIVFDGWEGVPLQPCKNMDRK